MKKHLLFYTNLLICLILIIGFASTAWVSHQTYRTVLEDDIENISKLTSSHIYAEINGELTKPIFVAQTMANDSFLKHWLIQEKKGHTDAKTASQIQEYLQAYRKKYQYDAVYAISASSNIYYYFNGINKVVSPKNKHDDWYYDFLESGEAYRLNIDTDEVNQNELTIFVDCRIEGANGELLGITGVGLKMSRLQELLQQHETDYTLQALLINSSGEITVSTDTKKIGSTNFFHGDSMQNLRDKILGNRQTMEIHWYPEGQMNNCIITRYIENLNWYLVVQKNTQTIRNSFQELLRKDLLIIAIMLALLLGLSTAVIQWYNRRLTLTLRTDTLTGLPNQEIFRETFLLTASREKGTLFLFDIDHFKNINDTDGHMVGNQALAQVAEIANSCVSNVGTIARWGGDEFIGALNCPLAEAEQILRDMQKKITEECHYAGGRISLSIGLTPIREGFDLDELTKQADRALYLSKAKGGGCISHSEEPPL